MKEYLRSIADFPQAVKTLEELSIMYHKISRLDYSTPLFWISANTNTEPPAYIKDIVNKK